MKNILFLVSGIIIGSWISWPGIVIPDNWKCVRDIIDKSNKEKISLKAALAVSPRFLLRADSMDNASKIRVVSDACFR